MANRFRMTLGGCHSFGMSVGNTIRDSEAFGVGLGLTLGMALAGDGLIIPFRFALSGLRCPQNTGGAARLS